MTQRKRATGFALMDTAFAADAKFVRLSRRADTPTDFAAAVGVYWLILADARRNRDRVVNWDDYTEYPDEIAALKDAGLLEDDGFADKSFNRWAPAYKSPWDAQRNGTQGDATVRESTQATPTSTPLISTPILSVLTNENGDALPNETDSATLACRYLPDGGRWLGDREYVAAFEDMDRRYTAEWVQSELQASYATVLEKTGKVRAWDLKRMVELRLAERSRQEETDRQRAIAERARIESEILRAKAENATDEEKERAAIIRKAVGLWMKRRPTEPIPTSFDELKAWLESAA